MPRESKKARRERAEEVYRLLAEEYPDAHCELDHRSPFERAVATILSAQTTDQRGNMGTPELFRRVPDAGACRGCHRNPDTFDWDEWWPKIAHPTPVRERSEPRSELQ